MRRLLAFTMAALLAAPIIAFAQPGHGRGPAGAGKMDYISELNLSREQLEQVRELQRESKKKAVEIKSKIQLKRIDFDEETQKDRPDPRILDRLMDDLAALHAQQYRAVLEARVKMLAILTPEQKHKLAERSLMGMRGHMMGMDDEPGMGSGPQGGMPPPPPPGRN